MDSIPRTTYRNVNFLSSDKIWLSVSINGLYLYSLRRLRHRERCHEFAANLCQRDSVSSLCVHVREGCPHLTSKRAREE